MELHLTGKRALVTAASDGLGFACAKNLAQEGASVVICSRDQGKVERTVASLRASAKGGTVDGLVADLLNSADIELLASQTRMLLGGIDILVVSTGHPPTHPLEAATDEDWERGISLLLTPVRTLSKLLIPGMIEQGYGRLIFIGSIFGIEPESSSIIQSTLRTGLNAFSKCLATAHAAQGITANVVCPGHFETSLLHEVAKGYVGEEGTTEEVLQEWREGAPAKAFGNPDDFVRWPHFSPHPVPRF